MIEQTIEVGPFTPQETEELVEKLKAQSVSFELLKDEETEKAEMKSDYANLVNKVELRTEAYLGQVFYLKINQGDFSKMKALFSEYGMATTPKENPEELNADIQEVHQDNLEQKRLQRILVWAFLAFLASSAIYLFRSTN